MPYQKSDARNEFEDRIAALIKTARIASKKKNNIPSAVRDLTYHAAVFEASACLEEYIKSVIDDFAFRVKAHNPPLKAKDLPSAVRSFIFLKSSISMYERYLYAGDERKLLRELDVNSSVFEITKDDNILTNKVTLSCIYNEKKYPSTKNWRRLFSRLGVNDVFGSVSSIIKRDAEATLTSFNDVRTAIAHQIPPSLALSDVIRNLSNALLLVKGIDRLLYRHFTAHAGQCCWPATAN